MKKYFSPNRLFLSCTIILILSLIAAVIPALQYYSNQIFYFGFPVKFLSIRASQTFQFTTHLNISAFIINLCIVYGILHIIDRVFIDKTRRNTWGK